MAQKLDDKELVQPQKLLMGNILQVDSVTLIERSVNLGVPTRRDDRLSAVSAQGYIKTDCNSFHDGTYFQSAMLCLTMEKDY